MTDWIPHPAPRPEALPYDVLVDLVWEQTRIDTAQIDRILRSAHEIAVRSPRPFSPPET